MRIRVLALVGALAWAACTDAFLYGDRKGSPPDQAAFTGRLCTDDPAERQFPVRVLLLLDTTVPDGNYSMQRGDSIERLVRSYAGPNYSYTVIRYAGPLKGTTCGQRNLTPDGYTKSLEEAIAGVRCADVMNPGRDLLGALSLASSVITGDVIKTPLGVRSRTKYVVILHSNGAPTVDLPALWCRGRAPPIDPARDRMRCEQEYFTAFCENVQPQPADCQRYQYVRVVRDMREFTELNGAQEFFFHVVYQRDPDDAMAARDDMAAMDLFAELALNGGGTVFKFPGAQTCNVTMGDSANCLFSRINLDSTQSVFLRRQLIVSNRSALAADVGLMPDSDQDGLYDEEELRLGTTATAADSDGDLLSDRVEHILRAVGFDPLRNEVTDPMGSWPVECPRPESGNPNSFPPDQDRDGDRLTDCEEILLRSDPTLFDSDTDGIPDPLELRYGTNLIAHDALEDADNDGFTNVDEYKLHLDPLSKDPDTDTVYQYEFRNEDQREVLSFTQPLGITGVQILNVSDINSEGRGTLIYTPPPDPSAALSQDNAALLQWHAPLPPPPGMDYGPGPEIAITGDGRYVVQGAPGSPPDPRGTPDVSIDVIASILPNDPIRQDIRLRRGDRVCFDFRTDRVQLVKTLPEPDTGRANVNYIDIFLAEVPETNPTSYGVFRVATIPLVYPDGDLRLLPPREDIQVANEDFLLFGE